MPIRPRVITVSTLVCALSAGLLIYPHTARALTFNFVPEAGTSQQAIDGFTAAGNIWSSLLTDNVTVKIGIAFTSIGSLADAGSSVNVFSYSQVRTALTNDITSSLDATAVSSLQSGPALQFVTNDVDGNVILDNNNSNNNNFLALNTATAKALGLAVTYDSTNNPASLDAEIRFDSGTSFDFNRADGIAQNSFDFIGIALHEIGHSLGFISGVDTVDYYSGPKTLPADPNINPNGSLDLNRFAVFSTLDLFRYSSSTTNSSQKALAGFPVQDLSQSTASYFSVDQGVSNLGDFATGPLDGDGNQASHWKGIGALMDPRISTGVTIDATETDLRAFDVMGWNRAGISAVPEPSTAGLLGFGFLTGAGLLLRRRRK